MGRRKFYVCKVTQFFRKIKIDPSDKLYSEIIRFGKSRCVRCGCHKPLQCAHIVGRGHQATRWMLKPVRNAIALCADCHAWFDGCKDDTPLFVEEARKYFVQEKNAYAFLTTIGYSWQDLLKLYYLGHRPVTNSGPVEKAEIRKQLKSHLENLKNEK